MENIEKYIEIAKENLIFYLPKILLAIVVLWLGLKIVNKLVAFLDKILKKQDFDESVRPFLISIINIALKVALFIVVVSILGADLTGLVAMLAAVGFAIGMALQGSLGNFASGILILTLKPYKKDDWIQLDDKFGKVDEIGIFNTIITTPGNKVLIVPNSKVTDGVVTNYSKKGIVRLEIDITMPYAESFPKVKKIIQQAIKQVPNILENPTPEIGIESFDSHSVQVTVRPYAEPEYFWQVTFDTHQVIKKAFSENKVQVAYSEGIELGSIGD